MGSRKEGAGAGAGQEQEDEGARAGGLEIAKTVGVVGAGLALLGWGISKLVSASSAPADAEVFGDNKKKMKAPGKPNEIIYREDFARNPSGYFRELRNKD